MWTLWTSSDWWSCANPNPLELSQGDRWVPGSLQGSNEVTTNKHLRVAEGT